MKHIKRLNNKQLSSVRTKIQFQRFNELNAMQFFRKYISSRNFKFQSSRGKLDLRQQFLRDISYPLPLGYGTEYRPTTSRITINPRRAPLTKEITSHLGPTESPSPPWARISGEKAFSRVARGHPFHWKWKRFPLVLDISEPRPLLQREKPRLLKTERRGAAFHASARTYRFPVAFSPRVISFHRFSVPGKTGTLREEGCNVSRLMTLERNRSSRKSRGDPPPLAWRISFWNWDSEFSFRLRLFVSIFERRVRLFSRWDDIELDTFSFWNYF